MVGLAARRRDLVRTFSRGMQQRLAIGRAVLHDPEVMLFDEPHTGLDQDACQMLDNVLREVAARGRTVVMTSHDLARVGDLASRFDVLSHGQDHRLGIGGRASPPISCWLFTARRSRRPAAMPAVGLDEDKPAISEPLQLLRRPVRSTARCPASCVRSGPSSGKTWLPSCAAASCSRRCWSLRCW